MGNCPPCDQSDPDRLIGTWKIVSIVSDVVDSNGRTTSHPANWHGYTCRRAIAALATRLAPVNFHKLRIVNAVTE